MNLNLIRKCVKRTYFINQTLFKSTHNNIEIDSIKFYGCISYLSQNLTSNKHHIKYNNNNNSLIPKKWYSSGNSMEKLPPLMDFPEIMWPSLIKSIRNFILSTFIIKPYFDNEFNLPDFIKGTKQALEVS